ncbi:hypothetical protein [Nocardia sp. NPDC057668]|uniref:hypothetical protein n=1 Tax=Nocardia sp. NPDC057668 TaxID=3346202 RepID=UPI00366D9E01
MDVLADSSDTLTIESEPTATEQDSEHSAGERKPAARFTFPELRLSAPTPSNRRIVRICAALLLVAAFIGAASVTGTALRDHRRTQAIADGDAAVIDTARRGVTALINIKRDTADADFARLAEITTAPFADELHSQSGNYLQTIRDADVLSSGQVVAAALAADDGSGAVVADGVRIVLVAADAQVTNTQSRQQEQRTYRFAVKIKDVDGVPKMSSVEFVP